MLNRRATPIFATILVLLLAACAQQDESETPDRTPSDSETQAATSTPDADASESESPDAEVDVEAGWELHEGDGFTIVLPEEWQVFDAETIADSGIFSELAEENAELEAVFLQVEAALQSGQTAFIAMELGEPATDGFAENVNIGASAYRGSVEDLEDESVAEIEAGIPVSGEVESQIVELAAHEAVRLQYGYALDTEDGTTLDVEVIQYLVVGDDASWVVTFSSTEEQIGNYEATFEESADSFTIQD